MSGQTSPETGETILAMSDEDILNMSGPPDSGEVAPGSEATPEVVEEPAQQEVEEPGNDPEEAAEVVEEEPETDDTSAGAASEEPGTKEDDPAGSSEAPPANGTEPKEEEEDTPSPGSEEGKEADKDKAEKKDEGAKTFSIPSSFKANGKTIELKNEQEALQLMQMGANYTRKMQDIAPHRKVLLMLQNNDLLDEGKLSYLIDLDKKDPEAIKKLIKDSGIDPMEIDTESEPTYLGGSHIVTDDQANFYQALEELTASDAGKETVTVIQNSWDQASKEVLWKSPELMSIIHEQRANGIYDAITAELDRRRTLGLIPVSTPFLQAYKIVGDELVASNAFGNPQDQQQTPPGTPTPEPEVVATRVATPKSPVANAEKASAASTTRSTPRKAEPVKNFLAMSDEEFLKLDQFAGRV